MVDTMQDGLVVHDASGAIVHFNAAACDILGLSAGQLLGKTSMDPSWRAIRRDGSPIPGNEHPAMRALHFCTPIRGEMMGVSRQGVDLRWIRINATPFDHNKPISNPIAGIPADRRVIVTFTDVTEMVNAQSNLDDFFNISMDIHCIAGADGFFKRVNPSFKRILGHSEDESLSTPFFEFINPLDRAATAEEIDKLQKGGITLDFENRYRTKSGEWRVLSWSCRADTRTGLIYASARDVTEQHAAERALKELMTSLNRTSIVAFTDDKGVITEVNDNFCQISGYRRDELIGKTHRIINSGEHPPQFFAAMWSAIKAGQLWTGDIKNRAKDGREYWVRTVISPISDRNGAITHYVAIRFEVTEQKRIEEEYRRLAQELQEAQRTAKIGSWTFDIGTGELGWSSEQYRIFEIAEPQTPSELYARYRERLHPDDIPALDEVMARAMEQGEGFSFDHRVLTADGQTKYVQGIGSVQFDSKGKPRRITGTYQDITARVVLQRSLEIERSKALHSAKLASLGELAAGVAHEINNPLAIISGTARVLLKYADRPEDLKSRIDTIERAIERVAKIVRGLKKFSRSIDRTELKPHALAQIAREALALTEASVKRSGAHIELQAHSEGLILCDEIEIEQVLVNLINNAVDAVKSRDERWVRVSISEADQQVVLRVTDSGPGIHPSIVSKLFQPFVTTKPAGEGTGLGLSIIKGILDEHRASVGVLPRSPHTCFEIRFPRLMISKGVA
jgi:PAS domain S-box-containing protein